jgi:hypothetical protein
MSKPTITRRDLGGVATGAGLLAAASGMIVEAPAQTAPKTFMLIHGAWHGGLRPCCAGGSRSGRWSLAELPFSHGRALVRGRNVPEKSRLRCSDLCRLCVCSILVLVLGPRNSSRGGKLLTAKAPARSEAARAFFAVTPATAVPTPPVRKQHGDDRCDGGNSSRCWGARRCGRRWPGGSRASADRSAHRRSHLK